MTQSPQFGAPPGCAELLQRARDLLVERRDGLRLERDDLTRAVVGVDPQLVIVQVEIDRERARAVGDRACRQPARRHVRRRLPPVVEHRRPDEAHLADGCSHMCSVSRVSVQSSTRSAGQAVTTLLRRLRRAAGRASSRRFESSPLCAWLRSTLPGMTVPSDDPQAADVTVRPLRAEECAATAVTSRISIETLYPETLTAAQDAIRTAGATARIAHIQRTDPGGCWVAESDGQIVGAALGIIREGIWGLSLFAMAGGGLIAGLVVALGAGLIARSTQLKEDASLAAFFLISLALGVTIVSVKGTNVDLLHFLFGSVLAVDDPTLLLIVGITSVSLIVLALIWRPLVLECVDPGFLRSVSRAGGPAHIAFLALVVMNLVGGFQALGTLLAVGIMMLPAVISRFWARDITAMIGVAIGSAALSGYVGLLVSYHANLPSGPAIILVAGVLYAVSVAVGPVGGLIWLALPQRHLEA